MKNHLNIFEYFSQQGVLPIENNCTRNLGIVLKNTPLAFFKFIDLVSEKSEVCITKPSYPDDWFIKLQVRIKDFAQEEIEIKNVVGITLTTSHAGFYGEDNDNDIANITDMAIYSTGTLIIIEAKRNNVDATEQLKRQITELKREWQLNNSEKLNVSKLISITWDEVLESLCSINNLVNESEIVLRDYIEHIKNTVPSFFPVQTFNKLSENDYEHIKRRIEQFAKNFGTEVIPRNVSGDTIYWVKLSEKNYVKELAYQSYNGDLRITIYPGGTIGQGRNLFNESNKLSILDAHSINIDDYNLQVILRPNIKVSNPWGKWMFDIDVDTLDYQTLKGIFSLCGEKHSVDNAKLLTSFQQFNGAISSSTFEDCFNKSFKKIDRDYKFVLSLNIGIFIEGVFEVLKRIDNNKPLSNQSDKIVDFTNAVVNKIYDLIEN